MMFLPFWKLVSLLSGCFLTANTLFWAHTYYDSNLCLKNSYNKEIVKNGL